VAQLIRDDGGYAVLEQGAARRLTSDPFAVPRERWQLGPSCSPGTLRAPVHPRTVLGIGRSYRAHAEELGNQAPESPLLFLKAPSSVLDPDAPLAIPTTCGRIDFEGEIAVVLASRLDRVAAADALSTVLGITAACDTTAREIQQGDRTFARGKSLAATCPIGPMIDLDPDWGNLEVVTRVNGVERQRGHERLLLWPIAEILAFVSSWIVLEAGDVILLGTPAGVGPLSPGDQLEVEVSGAGVLRNPVVAR
jgi:2-keto-4-pentenoate hydratase/2-oxohepta-3-ene-1,7-dioic acid hydratase in catechol pathway